MRILAYWIESKVYYSLLYPSIISYNTGYSQEVLHDNIVKDDHEKKKIYRNREV